MAINDALNGVAIRLTNIALRLITDDERPRFDTLLETHHRLGAAPLAGHQLRYVAEDAGRAVGLMAFSAPAYHLVDRDRWIGWNEELLTSRRHFVVQNSRLLVLGEKRGNVASRMLGLAAKRLPQDWRARFHYTPLVLETFVDPSHFRGTCYTAAGWQKIGHTRGFRRDGVDFYCRDSSPKDIYVKALQPEACQWLQAPKMPEPWQSQQADIPLKQRARRLTGRQCESLFERLLALDDARGTQGRKYPLACGLALICLGHFAGAYSLRGCEALAKTLSQPRLRGLRAWHNPHTQRYEAPCHTTLWHHCKTVNYEQFIAALSAWVNDLGGGPTALAIDGKALRATFHHRDGPEAVVSVVNHQHTPLFSTINPAVTKARRSPPVRN